MENAAPSKRRVVGIDVARGALMAWIVVAVHGVFWLELAPRQLASLMLFEMPVVFAITGAAYFLSQRGAPPLSFAAYPRYLLRRGMRILVPYAAYALACAAIVIVFHRQLAVDAGEALSIFRSWLNPIEAGIGHSAWMLRWHLWFIAPFLIVTAALPLITRATMLRGAPLWALGAGAAGLVFLVEQLDFPYSDLFQSAVFYGLWAVFGFVLAAAPSRFHMRDYGLVLALAVTALAALVTLAPAQVTLDMQANKFPPNTVFFVFSCAWMALIMMLVLAFGSRAAVAGEHQKWLQPFVSAGYSIYLWQGLGYSMAVLIGQALHWSALAIWPLAVALSAALGLIASPLERIKLGR